MTNATLGALIAICVLFFIVFSAIQNFRHEAMRKVNHKDPIRNAFYDDDIID